MPTRLQCPRPQQHAHRSTACLSHNILWISSLRSDLRRVRTFRWQAAQTPQTWSDGKGSHGTAQGSS